MNQVHGNKSHRERVTQATKTVQANQNERAAYRLGYHLMAPSGWMNDPNGLIYFNGQYHAFYQHYPYGETWGPMHWGHGISDDLIHWHHLPVALAPGEAYDRDGCFSGSAVDDQGTLTLIYTGHNVIDPEKDVIVQNQNIARSRDGIHFYKANANPVIQQQPAGMGQDFRDPKVWRENGVWFMVVGATKHDQGQVLLYESANLEEWTYRGVLAQNDGGNEGYMWECPDFFKLGDKYVLLASPQGVEPEGDRYLNHHQTVYMVGDYVNGQFIRSSFTELDYGHDFYAVQTLLDGKGRRIAIGWMDMWESPKPSQKHGWAGAMTLPRELVLTEEGKIAMKPIEELTLLRQQSTPIGPLHVKHVYPILSSGNLVELEAQFALVDSDASAFGIRFCCAADGSEETVLRFDLLKHTVTLDRSRSGEGPGGARTVSIKSAATIDVRLFIDRSSVEVFINDGETVITSRIYPQETSTGMTVFAEGGSIVMPTCTVHKLKSIWSE